MPKQSGLTPKQQRFVEEYLVDLNGTQAAIRAGYAPKNARITASQNLAKPIIARSIKELRDKQSRKTNLTAEYVLASLQNVAERCQQAQPVLDREGNPTGEYRFDSSGANKALELLGKHLALFVDRVQHEGNFSLVLGGPAPTPPAVTDDGDGE